MIAFVLAAESLLGHVETGTSGQALVIRAAACRNDGRQLSVTLRDRTGRGRSTPAAPMPMWPGDLPCALERHGRQWRWQGSEAGLVISIEDAPLGRGVHGALVSIEGRGDHVHRVHALFVDSAGSAKCVWYDGDTVGYSVTSATPSRGAVDFQFILDWSVRDIDEQADEWRGEHIAWSPTAMRTTITPLPAFVIVAGAFDFTRGCPCRPAPAEREMQACPLPRPADSPTPCRSSDRR